MAFKLLPWSELKTIGNSKIFRSSYLWIFLVPILSGIFSELNQTINLLNNQITLKLSLPFKWYMFYFGAISFSIGLFLYFIKCPLLIKNFDDYKSFQDHGNNQEALKWHIEILLALQPKTIKRKDQKYNEIELLKEIVTKFCSQETLVLTNQLILDKHPPNIILNKTLFIPEFLSDVFFFTRQQFDYSHHAWRLISAFFFLIGAGFWLTVVIQGFGTVIKLAFPTTN